jgi:hypothetical protein
MRLKLDPRTPGFNTVKALVRRMEANPKTERDQLVSVNDRDVPTWQRQTVWREDEMGLLAFSILRNYPIGMLILWKKPGGARVPIDGRQRLTAIYKFMKGEIALPELPSVPQAMQRKKYVLLPEDAAKGFTVLSMEDREAFEDYAIRAVEYEGISEDVAMEIFVMLQGGKSLTKTEVRAALGGELCDFVTELTSGPVSQSLDDDGDEEEQTLPSRHSFFFDLSPNLANRRKSHRNVADILIHEHLYPGLDKHWSSLEKMYREKQTTLSEREKASFRKVLGRFHKASRISTAGKKVLMPQLRSAHFIQTVFRAWKDLSDNYDMPSSFTFARAIASFEAERVDNADDVPWVQFTAALSNAGYAQNRIQERHDILMSYILAKHPSAKFKARDAKRTFSIEQKIAIWERAEHNCEFKDENTNERCKAKFEHPRKADADHIVMWKNNGSTSLENGRLLCPKHNRGRRD